jgi:putative DNA primase/helicase
MDSISSNSTFATVFSNKSSQNTLLHKHMDYFVERGILLACALANARSITAAEATELLGFTAKSDGIWFEGANGVSQFRPDTRWKDKKGKLVGKFLSPLGSVCDVDIFLPNHPTDPSYWETESLKKACYQINDHPHIVTTEGPAKAIAGCAKGIPTVAVSGVENGLTGSKKDPEGKRFLVPTLRNLAEAGLGFIIAYDADVATNSGVVAAERTLAAQLGKFKVPVRSVTGRWVAQIEGKDTKGMDDFIYHRGIEEFRAILCKARLFDEAESLGETLDTGGDRKTKKPPTTRRIAEKIAEQYRSNWKYDNEQKVWRIWNDKCWEKTEIAVFTRLVKTALDAKNIDYPGSAYIKDVRELLEIELLQPKWQTWDKSRYINFNNCVFDGVKGQSEPHCPGTGFTSHLPYDYKPLEGDLGDSLEALRVNCPKVHEFFRTAMQGDERKMFKLLAIINAVLKYRFFDLQMFVHLVGAPGSGKGKFMRFCQKLVGKSSNTIACQLDKLGDGSTKASLMDKQLVVFPDERKPVGIDSILSLTGGDEISYRELYQPAASAHFYGSIMIASNKPIFIGDTTGLERRLCLVQFENPIATEKRDHSLEQELDSEIPACIAIALSLTDDAVTQAIQGIGGSQIAEFKAKEWEMKTETNSVATFLDMQLVLESGASTETMKLFEYYKDFCEVGGFKPLS